MRISVILPSYEEEENLKIILPKLHSELTSVFEKHEILVVDTMTPKDNTKNICEEMNAIYLPRKGGNNYGDAIRTGLNKAVNELIVIMDADGSHDPKYIKDFYNKMIENSCDVIIGSRYTKGGDSDNSFILKLMSWCVNFVYRVIFNLNVKDVSDSFRLYKADKLKSIDLECDNFDIVEEILIRLSCKYKNLIINEVPIFFNKRKFGESKRSLLKFAFSYLTTILKMWKIKVKMKK